jgi:putative addiction module component (TIGR02574 family)
VCPELKAELERRVAALEADPSRVLTWDQVLAHLKRPH